ncbi:MAG: outer membrane beta-barrel protein [Acidobacteria bacterium]|nr:outer membrane beta-barrel protein [Acidobacteriota bacterium]
MRGVLFLIAGIGAVASAQTFVGVTSGISTLSADAQTTVDIGVTATSTYKPENGALASGFAGRHITDYLSIQAGYGWNRNSLTLTSIRLPQNSYLQSRNSSQHSGFGDALLYFRNRRSRVRPFLLVGIGVTHFTSHVDGSPSFTGSPALPPRSFSATEPGLRVAAGIDLLSRSGWGFRYMFLETMQRNPISQQLSPPGARGLANFQNVFGFVKYF